MIAPLEGSIWSEYWKARAERPPEQSNIFDAAVAALHDVRNTLGTNALARDVELFDAMAAVMAGLALRRHP